MNEVRLMLIGPPGSGKTSVGLALADKLGVAFIDSDAVIEKTTGMKVSQIFQELGEPAFRRLERELVFRLYQLAGHECQSTGDLSAYSFPQSFVLSAGGGLPAQADNMDLIVQSCLVVGLFAEEDELVRRLSDTNDRPLLASAQEEKGARLSEMREKIARLIKERRHVYERAHVKIKTDGRTIEQIADELVSLIKVPG